MEMLNKYPNAASVEEALDKGVDAYDQSEENKMDINDLENFYGIDIFDPADYVVNKYLNNADGKLTLKQSTSGASSIYKRLEKGHYYTIQNVDCPKFRVGIFDSFPLVNDDAVEVLVYDSEKDSCKYKCETDNMFLVAYCAVDNDLTTKIQIIDNGDRFLDSEDFYFNQISVSNALFEYGWLNSVGNYSFGNNKAVYTPKFYFVKAGTKISCPSDIRFNVLKYSSPETDKMIEYVSMTNSYRITEDCFIRVSAEYIPAEVIEDIYDIASQLEGSLYNINYGMYKEHYPYKNGSSETAAVFVNAMNKKASEIGMTNSVFADAAGYDTATNRSTARDLVKLGVVAMSYPELMKAWGKESYVIKTKDTHKKNITCQSSVDISAITGEYTLLGRKLGYMPDNSGGYHSSMLAVCVIENKTVVGVIGNAVSSAQRVDAMKELLDICKEIITNGNTQNTVTKAECACACILPENPSSYFNKQLSYIYEQSADTQFIPASTTKTLTVLTMIDYVVDIHEKIEFSTADGLNYGSGQIFSDEDVISYNDAIYAMMLSSSGPCSRCVARNMGQKMINTYL